MIRDSNLVRVIALTLFGVTVAAASDDALEARSIDGSIERAMQEFSVPGMAVSVVHRGEIVYARGHGILETGVDGGVDEHTLFQIASVSKAFTATALAILADEGKLDWNDPVIDHLPDFRMYDPWVTREFTVSDLLTHRSGLPLGAGDLLLFPKAQTTRDEVIRAMRFLKPSSSFRSEYAYDNLLYIIAGEVVASAAGMPFEDFLERRLLLPLQMSDCRATLDRVQPEAQRAIPHVMVDGSLQVTDSLETPVGAAAGGINCSAHSMARWARFVLRKGISDDGERLVSEARFAELTKPVTLLPGSGYVNDNTGAFLNAYALGWGVSTFYGEPMLSHGGGLWGMTTFLVILPEQELGIFVTNNLLSAAPRAVAFDIADRFLRGQASQAGKNWIEIVASAGAARTRDAADSVENAHADRVADSRPSLPLRSYAGTYRDEWYGPIDVTLQEDGTLYFQSRRSEPLGGPLEHFQFDTFIARWKDRKLNADAYVSFSLDPAGSVEGIRMKAVSPATDFSFDFHDLDLVKERH